nr:YdcF family protein [uncultured Gemmiger sp.]
MKSHSTEPLTRKGVLLQIILFLLAGVMLFYSVMLVFTSNFNMGNLIVWVLTAACCVYAVWHRRLNAWFTGPLSGRIVLTVLICGAVFYAGMLAFVAVSGYANPPSGNEKVVIVLGAGLRKDKPSLLLRYRLDKAYEFAQAHPDAVVITTGGQGRDEWVPEGQAMRDYLIEKGLSPDRVLAETRSTSTEENFAFARQIMEQQGMDVTQLIVYVTNAFHCYRGGKYAQMAGFDQVTALPAGIPLRSIPTCYLREVFAVLYYWVFRSSASGLMQNMVGILSLNKKFFYK